jgi:hypothetical protein
MNEWYYTLVCFFSCLVVGRNVFQLIVKILSDEPTKMAMGRNELVLLGLSVSYTLTYLLY